MFKHGKTGKIYYSVREKINYYSKIVNGNVSSTPELKAKAEKRLPELQKINNQSYDEPKIIITDDKFFGNPISKPRLCVAVLEDNKKRVLLVPIVKRSTKTIVLDNDFNRQISNRPIRFVDKNDIYERKYIAGNVELTVYDKAKIKKLFLK